MYSEEIHINDVADAAERFAEIFYDKVDKSRHTIGSLFHNEATLIWGGNKLTGKHDVVNFYQQLPTTSTTVFSIDAQPVRDLTFSSNEKVILLVCGGIQKFANDENKMFSQTFTLVSETSGDNKVWKIITDTFRFH